MKVKSSSKIPNKEKKENAFKHCFRWMLAADMKTMTICCLLSFYLYNNEVRTVVILKGLKHSRNRGDCPKGHY